MVFQNLHESLSNTLCTHETFAGIKTKIYENVSRIHGNIRPGFIFAHFALIVSAAGEFKTERSPMSQFIYS